MKKKEMFIKEVMQQRASKELKSEEDANSVMAQEMSMFYRKFLDENYQMHRDYNRLVCVHFLH